MPQCPMKGPLLVPLAPLKIGTRLLREPLPWLQIQQQAQVVLLRGIHAIREDTHLVHVQVGTLATLPHRGSRALVGTRALNARLR